MNRKLYDVQFLKVTSPRDKGEKMTEMKNSLDRQQRPQNQVGEKKKTVVSIAAVALMNVSELYVVRKLVERRG